MVDEEEHERCSVGDVMINFNDFCFAAAPGTGASWFLEAMQLYGFGPQFIHQVHQTFEGSNPYQFKLSIVRHPLSWLTWYFLQGRRHNYPELVDFSRLDASYYGVFLSQYLNRMPGRLTRLMTGYNADSYIKYEDLPDAFLEFMYSLGYSPPIQGSDFFHKKPWMQVMPNYWNDKIMQAEKELVDEFDYF